MRHIIPISGKDSLATAIWQTAHKPELPYEYVFSDTRAELPDTYVWLDKVEASLGIRIERIGKCLEQVIDDMGILPSQHVRFCTERAKIRPMNRFIGKERACVYYGLRADEPERLGNVGSARLEPKYPLREANIGLATVYRMVESRGLMPPSFFWQRLYDAVKAKIPDQMFILDAWPTWMKARTFAWRSRPNCYFCFFQRKYEWIGLLEHHPALFLKAEAIETRHAADRRVRAFFWVADHPLSWIRENAESIFQKRVDAVCALIASSCQTDLFRDSLDSMDIAGTSCGLLCGK